MTRRFERTAAIAVNVGLVITAICLWVVGAGISGPLGVAFWVLLIASIVLNVRIYLSARPDNGSSFRKILILAAAVALAVLIILGIVRYLSMKDAVNSMTSTAHESTESLDGDYGQYPDPSQIKSTADSLAPVGACVNLGGTKAASELRVVPCGSPENNYRVVQKVLKPSECVADVDQRYYQNRASTGEWTACLDYAWTRDSCLGFQGWEVSRVQCRNNEPQRREKPLRIVLNVTTASACPTGGFAHPVRRFTVCTETQR
ncbi:LppU/SCO3897 family protein [Mycobacteroides abscessus]|uniref:LppU/SCO3897 family protein n=1 Tax=Mycobacteroides abscessus TaxID=36809 RepID=UPI000926C325|nr:hypothetical protein [Mycobacteroides abscessus]SHW54720.1 Putative liporotein LppU [Mycobacteroides abscessus subsp. abscessus]SIA89542.1 Putative liporotein LppU [Mycobacteroides abscessus subsp. abscessus]SKR85129.1 Putative liporotein LppU [Mycobacteroides abscessus subsp. abscessus]